MTYRNDFSHNNNYENQSKYTTYNNKYTSSSNYQNNLFNNTNCKEWSYRYGRNGVIRNNIIKEDDDLFREHTDNMNKKKSSLIFNF